MINTYYDINTFLHTDVSVNIHTHTLPTTRHTKYIYIYIIIITSLTLIFILYYIHHVQVLRGFDKDIRRHLTEELVKEGFHVHTNVSINEIKKVGEENYSVDLQPSGSNSANGTAALLDGVDLCLAATGRKPKLDGLGLEKAGVEIDEKTGEIITDEQGKTSCDSIYALGDCTSAAKLTPVALEQGHCFADTFYGKKPRLPDLESVATAVFSYPNVGTVGLTESEAVNKYGKVTVYTSRYTPLKNHVGQVETPIADRGKDYMKICVDTATDRVVGLHMVGDGAGEIMQGFATAIKCGCKCIFTYIFLHNIHIYTNINFNFFLLSRYKKTIGFNCWYTSNCCRRICYNAYCKI